MNAVYLKRIRRAIELGLDVVYPRRCAACDRDIDSRDRHLCLTCRARLRLETARPSCPRCGQSVGAWGVQEGSCVACRDHRRPVDHVARGGSYQGEFAKLLKAYKFGAREDLVQSLGALLAEVAELAEWSSRVDALVYVPTHWRHAIGRRYYAAKMLAEVVSRVWGVALIRILRRVAAGEHQFNVPRYKREENVRGKFAMIRGARIDGARICLLDDVTTTGATLNECARVLKTAGAASVDGLVLAKVDDDMEHLSGV